MMTMHGIWWPPTFYLWGQRTGQDDPLGTHADGEPSDRPAESERHPTILSVDELHAAAGELSPDGLLASIAEPSELTIWLPCTNGDRPAPAGNPGAGPADNAPGLRASSQHASTLRALSVPALAFSPADAVDLLTGLHDASLHRCSDSLRYWRVLAGYTVSLLGRRQFVPTLAEIDDETFAGGWQVFVTDRAELAWLEAYVAAMPPVCQAVASGDRDACQPTRLVDRFIAETAEAVIRRSLDGDEFYRQIHDRARREDKWELHWLSSLIGDARNGRWGGADGVFISGRLRAWIGELERHGNAKPPELCFTLVEPNEDRDASAGDGVSMTRAGTNATWRVRFDLRSSDGQESLDIAQVWHDRAHAPSILGQHLVDRCEHIRNELARAAVVFKGIRIALSDAAPTGVDLDTVGAHLFIRDCAPLLQAQGFAVVLPEWAFLDNRQFGLELRVRPVDEATESQELALGRLGLGSMLDFDWRIAIGDDRLSPDEFEALATQGQPLVKVRGGWVDIEPSTAGKALDFIRGQPHGRLTLARAIRLAAGAEDADAGLPIIGLTGTSWVQRLLDESHSAKIESFGQPPEFRGTMRPYQVRGLEWLAFLDRLGIGSCLADDMGLGKTIQLIALLLHERRDGAEVGPTLLFVPMSVVGNWGREIERFAPKLSVLVHHGTDRLPEDAFVEQAEKHDVVITTYGLANRDLRAFGRVAWHRIALDEAQKIKNPSANQTIAVRALKAPRRTAMTGTPIENHLSELWSIMEMLNPGLMGSAATFRKQFAVPIEKMGDSQRAEQLRSMIRPFLLRRLKSDPKVACDLPEKMEMRVFCNLTPEQGALYEQTVRRMLDEVDATSGIRRRGLILSTLTKLKQVCNHPAHLLGDGSALDGRSGKCERIAEMLEEVLDEGDAALIFTQFKVMGDLLHTFLQARLGIDVPFLHGGTSAKARTDMVADFQAGKGTSRVFLLSLKAGGFGLNLTRANHVFHFDRWWNPAVESQATDRAHRIGQTRRVQVHKFVCIGTLEDRIDKLLTEKSAMADRIIGSGDDWLTGLSTTELREYLALTPEAVAGD